MADKMPPKKKFFLFKVFYFLLFEGTFTTVEIKGFSYFLAGLEKTRV
jgi:hypothetical protein